LGRKYDVFGIGTAVVDYFTRAADDFLKKNGLTKGATNFVSRKKLEELYAKLSGSIFACFPGDNARNVCEGVSFLGGRSAYASRIADDEDGKIFENSLRAQKIDSFLERGPGNTGKLIIFITPDSQRTFAADLGNGTEYSALPARGIKDSNFLYLTSITLLKKGGTSKSAYDAMKFAKENGVQVSISLESPPMVKKNKKDLLEIISMSDVLFANEDELEALTGSRDEKAARVLAENIPVVCLKRGKEGSVIFSRGERFAIPTYPTKVVDTTGAGDFYAAGVLFGLSRGRSVEEAGHQGSKLAAEVIKNFGAALHKKRHFQNFRHSF
jgi:sugar/nucleoside kinase (ribokinase family)